MPAPANDVFTSPVVCNGDWATQYGTNVGATDDAGGRCTVWYLWQVVPSTTNVVIITTRALLAGNAAFATNFPTSLKVFKATTASGQPALGQMITSSDPADGFQLLRLEPAQFTGLGDDFDTYGFWSKQAYVAFERAAVGPVGLYIAVGGKAGATGKFHLSWSNYYRRFLTAKCHQRASSWVAMAQAAIPNVTGPSTTQFLNAANAADWPAGNYRVTYCSGAFRYNATKSTTDWVTINTDVPNDKLFNNLFFIRINFSGGAAFLSTLQNLYGIGSDAPSSPAADQASAETRLRCGFADFQHAGGPISVQFVDDAYTDNVPGTSLPAFTLFRQA